MADTSYIGSIEAFKQSIPNIQRASLFDVTINNFKYGSNRNGSTNAQRGYILKFSVKSATFPASNLGDITINYMGRNVHFYGDRESGGDWQTNIILDGEWRIYDDIYAWNQAMGGVNRIVSEHFNTHDNFKVNAFVTAYSTDGQISRRAVLHGLFPRQVGELSMAWDSNAGLDLNVTWTYDYMTLDKVVAEDNTNNVSNYEVPELEGTEYTTISNRDFGGSSSLFFNR